MFIAKVAKGGFPSLVPGGRWVNVDRGEGGVRGQPGQGEEQEDHCLGGGGGTLGEVT